MTQHRLDMGHLMGIDEARIALHEALGAIETLDHTHRTQIDQVIQSLRVLDDRLDYMPIGGEKEPTLTLANLGHYHELEARVAELEKELEQRNRLLDIALNENRQQRSRLEEVDRLAAMGEMVAGIAHEIKNPLNFVNNLALLSNNLIEEVVGLLPQGGDSEQARELAETIDELKRSNNYINDHGKRALRIIESMMNLALGKEPKLELVNLNILVDEHANLAYHGHQYNHQDQRVRLIKEYDHQIGDRLIVPQSLGRVIINLVSNAMDALLYREDHSSQDHTPEIRVRTHLLKQRLLIEIQDNGAGISPENIDRIFKPFFSTKKHKKGNLGLGLAICRDIITQQHGGELTVISIPGEATLFTISLPLVAPDPGA